MCSNNTLLTLVEKYQSNLISKEEKELIFSEILCIFEPKIKAVLTQTKYENREDLKQELQIKLMTIVQSYELKEIDNGMSYLKEE